MTINDPIGVAQSDSRKRSIIEVEEEERSKKRQKISISEDPFPEEKALKPYQKLAKNILSKCCDEDISFDKRNSNFFVLFLEKSSEIEFHYALLEIINRCPGSYILLAECIGKAEKYGDFFQQMVDLLSGSSDERYLHEIGTFSDLSSRELITKRMTVLGHVCGLLLKALNKEFSQTLEIDDSEERNYDEKCPSLAFMSDWLEKLEECEYISLAISSLTDSYSKVLRAYLIFREGELLRKPWNWRVWSWNFNKRLLQILVKSVKGRFFIQDVLREYATHSDKYETSLFFKFILEERSVYRNCLSESLTSFDWFLKLVRNWIPETLTLFVEANITLSEIHYSDSEWKKELQLLMKEKPLSGLGREQKQVLAWAYKFAKSSAEFWHYLSANDCLNAFTMNLNFNHLKNDLFQLQKLIEDLFLAGNLSDGLQQGLVQRISELATILISQNKQYFPNLFERLFKHMLRGDYAKIPSIPVGSLMYEVRQLIQKAVSDEYILMDSLIHFFTTNLSEVYPDSNLDLIKVWRNFDRKNQELLVNTFVRRCLNAKNDPALSYHILLHLCEHLNDDELDLVINSLLKAEILDQKMVNELRNPYFMIHFRELYSRFSKAIKRRIDSEEIIQFLGLRNNRSVPIQIFFEFSSV